MIKSITVTNYLGEELDLELMDPYSTGFIIKEIEGLGPAKGSINATDMATNDGSVFNSSRINKRNIVLTLRFLDGQENQRTIEDLRQLSYKYFPVKRKLTFKVKTDNREAYATGYVESNSINIFSQNEEAQISIICPDPYFYSVATQQTTFFGVTAGFEFPFSNESLIDKMIEFGAIEIKKENSVYYEGDTETGVIINIHALGQVDNLTIYNVGTREVMNINTDIIATIVGGGITAGDDITISTIRGNKYIRLLRQGITYNILNCLGKNADWFQISKGDNIFTFTADYGEANLQFSITSQVIYEGI